MPIASKDGVSGKAAAKVCDGCPLCLLEASAVISLQLLRAGERQTQLIALLASRGMIRPGEAQRAREANAEESQSTLIPNPVPSGGLLESAAKCSRHKFISDIWLWIDCWFAEPSTSVPMASVRESLRGNLAALLRAGICHKQAT